MLVNQKLDMEKGFDFVFLCTTPYIKFRVEYHEWAPLAATEEKANASMVREIYAEIVGRNVVSLGFEDIGSLMTLIHSTVSLTLRHRTRVLLQL